MTNKRVPVVGDWITAAAWRDDYFEVSRVTSSELWVKVSGHPDVSYDINGNDWLFKPSPVEDAIALLKENGYDITPPKPKLTGKVAIYKFPSTNLGYVGDVEWTTHRHTTFHNATLIAIVDWTEGDGI